MGNETWTALLGIVAGLASTSSFVPQLVKAWRGHDRAAISKRMYILTVTAFILWSFYGFLIGSWVLVVFNLISLALSASILILKSRDAGPTPPSAPAGG